MTVIKVAEHDVWDKIDTQFISSQFRHVHDTGITFLCTPDEQGDDEWTDADGKRHIVIRLPYEEVRQMSDVTALMLNKAKERLGMVE